MQSVYNLHLCIKKSWLLWEYRFQKCAHRIKNSLNFELNSPKGFVRCLKLLEIWYQYRTKTLDLSNITSSLAGVGFGEMHQESNSLEALWFYIADVLWK